jgi:hypothetical protein
MSRFSGSWPFYEELTALPGASWILKALGRMIGWEEMGWKGARNSNQSK